MLHQDLCANGYHQRHLQFIDPLLQLINAPLHRCIRWFRLRLGLHGRSGNSRCILEMAQRDTGRKREGYRHCYEHHYTRKMPVVIHRA